MTGGTPPRDRDLRPGAAIAGLLAFVFLLVGRGAFVVPEALVPITLPLGFWSLLALVVVLGYLGYFTMVRASTTSRVPRGTGTAQASDSSPPFRPHAAAPEIEAPARTAPSRRAVTARSDSEISKLIEWIDGVSAQIAGWGSVIHAPVHDERVAEEMQPSTMVVNVPREPRLSRAGPWTEMRARKAIEKYLRRQPWAPAADIAKALHMEVGLAVRMADSLRERAS